MTLDITKSVDIIETMENYISKVRPEPEIRNKLDLNYEISDQSVILNEIRPAWMLPESKSAQFSAISFAQFMENRNAQI
jgi:hypothetical protein